jgi:hypothetical protein
MSHGVHVYVDWIPTHRCRLNYVLSSTKAAILAELVERAEVEGDDARAIVSSPVWDQIPQLLVSPNIEIWSSAYKLSNLEPLEDFGMNEPRPCPTATGLASYKPILTSKGTPIR